MDDVGPCCRDVGVDDFIVRIRRATPVVIGGFPEVQPVGTAPAVGDESSLINQENGVKGRAAVAESVIADFGNVDEVVVIR